MMQPTGGTINIIVNNTTNMMLASPKGPPAQPLQVSTAGRQVGGGAEERVRSGSVLVYGWVLATVVSTGVTFTVVTVGRGLCAQCGMKL